MRFQGLAVAALSVAFSWSAACAAEPVFQFLPEPDFQTIVVKTVEAVQPRDAFKGLAQCEVVDAHTFAPVTAEHARKMLAPCFEAVGNRYQTKLRVEALASARGEAVTAQIEGLAVYVPEQVGVLSPVMRDLEHSLSTRNGRILGQPVSIRHEPLAPAQPQAAVAAEVSALQHTIDNCYTTDVVREIATSEDFIASYGRCIVTDPKIRVRAIRPSVNRPLGVTVQSEADPTVVSTLNGQVRVLGPEGPITVSVTAFPSSEMSLP